jgi:hypothetical protein
MITIIIIVTTITIIITIIPSEKENEIERATPWT